MAFPLEISCGDLHAMRERGEPFRLVDVREEDEWRFNRIEGAQLVPLSGFAAAASRTFPDPEEKIILY
jgi:rhodanese-related sulfurtransferase